MRMLRRCPWSGGSTMPWSWRSRSRGELRRGVVINRKNQLKAIYESMDDGDERRAIEARVITLNRYQTVVTAPRRSPVYCDLRDRVEEFK